MSHPTDDQKLDDLLADIAAHIPPALQQSLAAHGLSKLRSALKVGWDLAEKHYKVGPYAEKSG